MVYKVIERGDVDRLSTLLTDDFRFTTNDPGFAATFPEGFSRDDELNFLRRMKEAGHQANISYQGLTFEPLPPRNPVGIFLVRVKGATMRILQGEKILAAAGPSEHLFEVICVALPAAEGREGSRCRVRRWHEDAAGILAAIADGPDASAMVAGSPDPDTGPERLGLQVLSNGRRGGVALSVALPGAGPATLEMFDITGRRVESRDLALTRGTHTVGVPSGLPTGVYWARVRQAGSARTARVIVVR
jgi:hypothetical protein